MDKRVQFEHVFDMLTWRHNGRASGLAMSVLNERACDGFILLVGFCFLCRRLVFVELAKSPLLCLLWTCSL